MRQGALRLGCRARSRARSKPTRRRHERQEKRMPVREELVRMCEGSDRPLHLRRDVQLRARVPLRQRLRLRDEEVGGVLHRAARVRGSSS